MTEPSKKAGKSIPTLQEIVKNTAMDIAEVAGHTAVRRTTAKSEKP
ncbi:MAG: hypothetical protein PHI85_09500 [Victivallaceae bacterium]|nr:hypothetical protein [Victivallaceae bacterium]